MIALAVGPAQSPCRGERLCDRPLGTQLMGSSRATKGITVPLPPPLQHAGDRTVRSAQRGGDPRFLNSPSLLSSPLAPYGLASSLHRRSTPPRPQHATTDWAVTLTRRDINTESRSIVLVALFQVRCPTHLVDGSATPVRAGIGVRESRAATRRATPELIGVGNGCAILLPCELHDMWLRRGRRHWRHDDQVSQFKAFLWPMLTDALETV